MTCSCGATYDQAAFERGSTGFTLLPPGPSGEAACAQEFSNACPRCPTTTARFLDLDTFLGLVAEGLVEFEPGRMVARRVRAA